MTACAMGWRARPGRGVSPVEREARVGLRDEAIEHDEVAGSLSTTTSSRT